MGLGDRLCLGSREREGTGNDSLIVGEQCGNCSEPWLGRRKTGALTFGSQVTPEKSPKALTLSFHIWKIEVTLEQAKTGCEDPPVKL